jgi:copper chaperone
MRIRITYLILAMFLSLAACKSGSRKEVSQNSEKVTFTEIRLSVGGMHCGMCEASIEKGLMQLAGVDSVKAVMTDSVTFVRYNPVLVSEEEISKVIETRGYRVKGNL